MNNILSMEKTQVTNKLINNDDNNQPLADKIYIFPENKNSHGVTLNSNGKLYHGKTIGKWLYKNNRLLLFLEGKCIQLLVNNNIIKDSNELKWYNNSNLEIGKFISKYGEQCKLIILIITCYKRLELAKQINESWVNDFRKMGLHCFFVVGNMNQPSSKLKGDFLFVTAPDTYEALPSKVYHAFKYCYENFNFSYIYKIDDDTVVNPIKLLQLDLNNHDYIGKAQQVTREFNRYWHRTKCQNKNLEKIPYPSQRIVLGTVYAKGEAGYFLSRNAVGKLQEHSDYICSDLYEDKVIGETLLKCNIKLISIPEYTTKLHENFNSNKQLDQYCVIIDVGNNIKNLYNNHFQYKIQ